MLCEELEDDDETEEAVSEATEEEEEGRAELEDDDDDDEEASIARNLLARFVKIVTACSCSFKTRTVSLSTAHALFRRH